MLEVLSVLEKLDVPFGKWTEDIAAIREAKSLSSIVRASWKLGLGVGTIRFGLKLSRINYRESKSLIFDTSSFM